MLVSVSLSTLLFCQDLKYLLTLLYHYDLSGSRSVKYTDRNSMHFTMSFITEVFRLAATFSSLLHSTSKDITVRGQIIPEG